MPEQHNIEWKASWKDEYLKWINGFANAKGGKIFIGKDDDGSVVGVDDYKKLMDEIPNKIQNYLGIVCDVYLHEYNDLYFIEIEVKPYEVPIPYQGKYYYRAGSTKQELKGNALNDFLLKKTGKTWDDVIETKASLSDLDSATIAKFAKDASHSKRLPAIESENDYKQILQNLQLIENGELKRAAIVLFAKEPRRFFINAYAKIGKFGNSDHDLESQEVIEVNAYNLADQILEILDKKYFIKTISYEGLHRIETAPYPYNAIREALLNAIIHRNYFGPPIQISLYIDKIMIWNVGELPAELTIGDLKHKHASYPKNQRLADVFFLGGYIEAWGRGILKIITECLDFGLPEPTFEILTGGICVTIYKNPYSNELLNKLGLNGRQIEAIQKWKMDKEVSSKQYKDFFKITDRTALRDLTELTEKGLLVKRGVNRNAKYIFKNL